jgi:hypothetical protein
VTYAQRAAVFQLAVNRTNAATAALPIPLRRTPLHRGGDFSSARRALRPAPTVVTARDALELLLFTLPGGYRPW